MRDYNVYSYTVLHYGIDYLPYSLKSIYDSVDRLYIFYTPHPSHGHRTDIPPIESREDLLVSANSFYASEAKISWRETDIWHEGQQRDYAVQALQNDNADLILVCDYDEIWHEHVLDKALRHVWEMNGARNWLINFRHAWRSFNFMCDDQNWPVRIIDTRHSGGQGYIPKELGDIYHFGYCTTDAIMHYKWQVHGHKSELRPNWFTEKWDIWPPAMDCHPTNSDNWWMPQPFDKRELPYIMRQHPFYNAEIVK